MVSSSTNLGLFNLFLVLTFHFFVVRKNRYNHRDLTKDILCYPKGVKYCVPLLEFLNTFHSVKFHRPNKQLILKDEEWFFGRDFGV